MSDVNCISGIASEAASPFPCPGRAPWPLDSSNNAPLPLMSRRRHGRSTRCRVALTSCIAQVSHFAISPATVSGTSSQRETGGSGRRHYLISQLPLWKSEAPPEEKGGRGESREWTEDSSCSPRRLKDPRIAEKQSAYRAPRGTEGGLDGRPGFSFFLFLRGVWTSPSGHLAFLPFFKSICAIGPKMWHGECYTTARLL